MITLIPKKHRKAPALALFGLVSDEGLVSE